MSLNKVIDPNLPTALKVFIRACFGLVFFSPLIIKDGLSIFKSRNYTLHVVRILFMSMAMGGTYFTYANLPFPIATAVGFTGPIFTAVISYLILKDILNWNQWLAILVGYIGVLLLINPQGEINNAIYVAIFANIVTGLNLIYVKKLTSYDSRNTIVILGNIGVIITSSIWVFIIWVLSRNEPYFNFIVWQLPNFSDIALLMCMGFLGAFSQIAYVSALTYASPAFLGPFEYSRLVIAVPIGLALGDALPQGQEITGILVIISATLYLSWKGYSNDK
jgi:drug/metabolite transporter (DMT)-like permease